MISLGKPVTEVTSELPELPASLEHLERIQRLGDRLRTTYTMAMRTRHECPGRVEIHVSSEMPDLLRKWANFEPGAPAATIWGFPIVVDERLPGDTIQVHSVTTIR
jgi:hypothetical protein